MNLYLIIFVGVGGFIGAILRYLISFYMQKLVGSSFAYGTLTVNIVGSLIIGFLYLYFEHIISPNIKALLVTGMLGALTTFSTFSLETILMVQEGLISKAFLNIVLNVIFALTGTVLGMFIFKKIYGI
jgi:CrcB protein